MMNSGVFSRFRVLGEGLGVCAKYLLLYPLLAPRRTVHFLWMLGHQILSYNRSEAHAQIPSKTLEAIFPGIERVEVTLADASYRDGNMTTRELYTLCALARHLQTRSVLEIGTFDGLVITHLARNTDSEAHLVTVDLGPEDLQHLRWPLAPGEATYVKKPTIGEKIDQLPPGERSRIKQLYGDSTQLDFQSYYNQVDLVFIDGSHRYEYVEHDSQEAFRMRSPQGIIVWHDYLSWPDVTRYLNRLRHQYPIFHIEGTSFVVYQPET